MSHPDPIVSLADNFQEAALTGRGWTRALEQLASATGSPRAQLIGFNTQGLMFNWVAGMGEDSLHALDAINGHDPRINSRVRIGGQAPELAILTERDFSTDEDMAADPAYRGWIEDYGSRFFCLSPLWRGENRMVGLSIARTPKEGDMDHDAREFFARIAPHVRSAANTMMALGDRAPGLLAEALGGIEIAAIICDAEGYVHATSEPAEALLEAGSWLMVQNNRLQAQDFGDRSKLVASIRKAAATHSSSAPQSIALRSDGHVDRMLLDITRMPGERKMHFGRVLLVARPPKGVRRSSAIDGQLLFDLTATEAAIVAQMMSGQSAAMIADKRGVSIGTIRTHIRHILEKAGVTSQIELLARMNARI
jgi:DNA-binding CsgD family transcriptional regulator